MCQPGGSVIESSERPTVTVYVGIGANLGDRVGNIRKALRLIGEAEGVSVASVSAFHETEPVGPPQAKYLNAAAELETSVSASQLLVLLQEIENRLGRVRAERWGPRMIDLDILLYGDLCLKTEELVIPHPLMAERDFVLRPLAEIAPDVVHPVLGETVRELLAALDDCELGCAE